VTGEKWRASLRAFSSGNRVFFSSQKFEPFGASTAIGMALVLCFALPGSHSVVSWLRHFQNT